MPGVNGRRPTAGEDVREGALADADPLRDLALRDTRAPDLAAKFSEAFHCEKNLGLTSHSVKKKLFHPKSTGERLGNAVEWKDLAPLVKARLRRGDQKVLASQLGLEPSTVSNYLEGRRTPQHNEWQAIARFAGVDPDTGAPRTESASPVLPDEMLARIRELAEAAARVADVASQYGAPPQRPKPKSGVFKRGSRQQGR
jgi:transcriptional regulator with XRE-family HTH domain